VWPFARRGYLFSHRLQSAEKKIPVLGGTRSGGETNGDVALFRERLQQAYDVARERSAGSKRWRACRKLHRLTVIDAIGYGVIPAAAGDGGSRYHELSADTEAVY
jgi:hypothetical protein